MDKQDDDGAGKTPGVKFRYPDVSERFAAARERYLRHYVEYIRTLGLVAVAKANKKERSGKASVLRRRRIR